MEVWIGLVELRQLPGKDHAIVLNGRGAFTWITCWAHNEESYLEHVAEVMKEYGLFVVGADNSMPYSSSEAQQFVTDELIGQYEQTSVDQKFCIFGTFHSYKHDN